ncbi:MAG: hypothetical protein KatS3mg110_0834 [Pirellulaceae bacterium]|nr:MAG: hypothetical protein KatS3mg110_0834 [Pirellulaceae bacterium]
MGKVAAAIALAVWTFGASVGWADEPAGQIEKGVSQAPEAAAKKLLTSSVQVALYAENVQEKSWDFELPSPYLEYTQPWFVWCATPKRYTETGVIDRQPNPFLLRAESDVRFPAGRYRFLLRAKNGARLFVDEKLVAQTAWMSRNASGHEPVGDLVPPLVAGMWLCPPANQEVVTEEVDLDGRLHRFRLEAIVGGKGLRPEIGELTVAWRRVDNSDESFYVLAPERMDIPFTESVRDELLGESQEICREVEKSVRRAAYQTQRSYWDSRHRAAQERLGDPAFLPVNLPPISAPHEAVDHLLEQRATGVELAPVVSDEVFLRRAYLDLVGVIPTEKEMDAYWQQPPRERRRWLVDRLLADDRWADPWVAFWQDLLAENPGIVKPELNNTGPFRFWIYESMLDEKPLDRFVTELVLMEGGKYEGGPAGFSMATQNDVPMAAKAHVLAQAFLAKDLSCARCHDSPLQPYRQQELFSLAAMLARQPLVVPPTSSVPVSHAGRRPAVEVTLHPGDQVDPHWPWQFTAAGFAPWRNAKDTREQVAWAITSPDNERFAQVMANRVWHRLMGWALAEPLDDWSEVQWIRPELLNYLARQFLANGYQLKPLVRTIVLSRAYQRPAVDDAGTAADRAAPMVRRLSAEQLVDSLFVAAGKSFDCEPITMDQEGRRPYETFLNLGRPQRAWQLAGLSNERDRPALALPAAQSLVDLMSAFGWRDARPHPASTRDHSPQVLQPLTLANGVAVYRALRLSDDSRLVEVCLEAESPRQLVRRLFRRVLTREPTEEEYELFAAVLAEGFAERATGLSAEPLPYDRRLPERVSWSNHLSPEATQLKMQWEEIVRQGPPPTRRLTPSWRERCEDVMWALVNSPEFVFIP